MHYTEGLEFPDTNIGGETQLKYRASDNYLLGK